MLRSLFFALGVIKCIHAQTCVRMSSSNSLALLADSQFEPYTRPTEQTGPVNHWAVTLRNMKNTHICKFMRMTPPELRHTVLNVNRLPLAGIMLSISNDDDGQSLHEIFSNFDRGYTFSTEPPCPNDKGVTHLQINPIRIVQSWGTTYERTVKVPGQAAAYIVKDGFFCRPGTPDNSTICAKPPADLAPTLYPNIKYSMLSNCFVVAEAKETPLKKPLVKPQGVPTLMIEVPVTEPPTTTAPPPPPTTQPTTQPTTTLKADPNDPDGVLNGVFNNFDEKEPTIFLLPKDPTTPQTITTSQITTTLTTTTTLHTTTAPPHSTTPPKEDTEFGIDEVFTFIKSGASTAKINVTAMIVVLLVTIFCICRPN
ncbi:ORF73 [Ranid herpesvirus 2]|uniref:ORF73 n=1 Tax=Ranid herpesvirus 2 TaxID=389214 RepID=Q14W33_9VIRU|nr:ORF73 [Ranid herpesvirus 2]ABG25624.1 ORF73 [Ranid herpesvirus 2]